MGDLVVTSLLAAHPDPQRGHQWAADPAEVTVAESVAAHGHHLVVLHDCLDTPPPGPVEWVRVDGLATNPYFARWDAVAWLLARRDADRVWCVDASDVVMLADPFPHMGDALHVGSEPTTVADQPWVADHHPDHAGWVAANGDRRLLNPGLVGGPAKAVAEFARAVADWWPTGDLTDVARANKVAYDLPAGRLVTGHPVHTVFRSYTPTPGAWWQHK